MKLELLRSNTDLSAEDKLQLLGDHFTLGDWNKLTCQEKTVKLTSWLQAKGRKLTGTWLAALPLTQLTDVWQELTHTVEGEPKSREGADDDRGRISERECPETPEPRQPRCWAEISSSANLPRASSSQRPRRTMMMTGTRLGLPLAQHPASMTSSLGFQHCQEPSKHIGKKRKANKDDEEQVTKNQIQWLKSALSKAITVVGCKAFETTDGDKRGHAAKAKGELEEILSEVSDKGDVWEHKEFQAIQQNAKEKITLRKDCTFSLAAPWLLHLWAILQWSAVELHQLMLNSILEAQLHRIHTDSLCKSATASSTQSCMQRKHMHEQGCLHELLGRYGSSWRSQQDRQIL